MANWVSFFLLGDIFIYGRVFPSWFYWHAWELEIRMPDFRKRQDTMYIWNHLINLNGAFAWGCPTMDYITRWQIKVCSLIYHYKPQARVLFWYPNTYCFQLYPDYPFILTHCWNSFSTSWSTVVQRGIPTPRQSVVQEAQSLHWRCLCCFSRR